MGLLCARQAVMSALCCGEVTHSQLAMTWGRTRCQGPSFCKDSMAHSILSAGQNGSLAPISFSVFPPFSVFGLGELCWCVRRGKRRKGIPSSRQKWALCTWQRSLPGLHKDEGQELQRSGVCAKQDWPAHPASPWPAQSCPRPSLRHRQAVVAHPGLACWSRQTAVQI